MSKYTLTIPTNPYKKSSSAKNNNHTNKISAEKNNPSLPDFFEILN